VGRGTSAIFKCELFGANVNPIGKLWEQSETRYIVVGAWNTLFAVAIFVIVHKALSENLTITETLTIAFGCGVVQSFATQKKYVWRSPGSVSKEFPKFLLISALQYLANVILLKMFTTRFSMNAILSQILITSALILITYIILKLWVFKNGITNQEPVRND
jgi:putative flippase GtrA